MKHDLIEAAASIAEAETNTRPCLSSMGAYSGIPVAGMRARATHPTWTPEEDAFLKANLGLLSVREIGRELGRSASAVSNRWERDLHLTSPRRNPNWLTMEAFSRGLDVDSHSLMRLADRGLIPVRPLPVGIPRKDRGPIRVIDRKIALEWIADPMHWVYFNPERVATFRKHGQRLMGRPNVVFWREAKAVVAARLLTWKDEWLRPTEAARLIGLPVYRRDRSCHGINKAINLGLLPAVRWGNWWILRSEVLRFAHARIEGGWGPRKIKRIRFIATATGAFV